MDSLNGIEAALEKIVLDPKYHDVLTLVKGVRNGIVYGTKVRFPHALVMVFLFRHGSYIFPFSPDSQSRILLFDPVLPRFRSKLYFVFKATRQHARNLGFFALVYKSTMLFLRHTSPTGKERHYDSFLAGLVGGYTVFGRDIHNSVSQQIVIYVFARVCLAIAKLLVQPRDKGKTSEGGGSWGIIPNEQLRQKVQRNGWPVFASVSWAAVMYVFRWHPETVQPSLRNSMHYIYVSSDHWDSLRNFVMHNK